MKCDVTDNEQVSWQAKYTSKVYDVYQINYNWKLLKIRQQ